MSTKPSLRFSVAAIDRAKEVLKALPAAPLSGTNAIVGAYQKPGTFGPGAAYLFTGSGPSWAQTTALAPSAGEYFGFAAAISGSTAVVGGFGASNNAGAASILAVESTVANAVPALGPMALIVLTLLLAIGGATHPGRARNAHLP